MTAEALLSRYHQAHHYIDQGLIRTASQLPPSDRTRRAWMQWLLPALGQPQLAYPAVHVAGTSGKGSVSVMIAEILRAAGLHTGLHISPFLQVATEKLWVDGQLATVEEYKSLVDWIKTIIEPRRRPDAPLHGMASVALCLEHFRRENVDVAVIEAGVGGRNDLTNVLRTELAVLTSLGWDHLKTLGPTLEDIAWHKVGVIQPGSRAVAVDKPGAERLIEAAKRQAADVGATLHLLSPDSYQFRMHDGHALISYRGDHLQLSDASIAMPGPIQAHNAALAIFACEQYLGHRLTAEAVIRGLAQARLPGRIETIQRDGEPMLILDGAHNADKLRALIEGVRTSARGRTHLLLGVLQAKFRNDALAELCTDVDSVTLTQPSVYAKQPASLGALLGRLACSAHIAADGPTALKRLRGRVSEEDTLLVTGSLYLAGNLRERYFPSEAILAQRTPWPE